MPIFLEPVVRLRRESLPIALLSLPDVLLPNEALPNAEFELPVLSLKAITPKAALPAPVVLFSKAKAPTAVLLF